MYKETLNKGLLGWVEEEGKKNIFYDFVFMTVFTKIRKYDMIREVNERYFEEVFFEAQIMKLFYDLIVFDAFIEYITGKIKKSYFKIFYRLYKG